MNGDVNESGLRDKEEEEEEEEEEMMQVEEAGGGGLCARMQVERRKLPARTEPNGR